MRAWAAVSVAVLAACAAAAAGQAAGGAVYYGTVDGDGFRSVRVAGTRHTAAALDAVRRAEERVLQRRAGLDARQNVLISNPVIFGVDFLGWGVDLRMQPEHGLKVPIYPFAFSEGNEYLYPLEPQTTFRVPDEVFVRTVAEMVAHTRYYTSVSRYILDLNIGLGLGIKTSSQGNSSSSGGGGGGGLNSTSVNNLDLSSFSGDLSVNYRRTQLEDNQHIIIDNSLENSLWQLVLGPSISPRQRVLDAIDRARAKPEDQRGLAFAEFIERHGTHFVESVIVGGKLTLTSTTRKSDDTTSDDLAIRANVEFKKMFGLDELEVSLNFTFQQTQQEFQRDTNNDMGVKGGDPDLANFFGGPDLDPAAIFVAWSRTLISNPAVIRYRLREISWLFDTDRAAVSKVVQDYLNGRTPF